MLYVILVLLLLLKPNQFVLIVYLVHSPIQLVNRFVIHALLEAFNLPLVFQSVVHVRLEDLVQLIQQLHALLVYQDISLLLINQSPVILVKVGL